MAAKKYKKHKQFMNGILCLLGAFVALSFVAPLLPIAGASASTMPCCVGKAGHCDSGIAAKKPPQPKEPMCGLHNESAEDDGITVVAKPTHAESHHASASSSSSQPAVQSASLKAQCRMECGACTTASTRQQKRERAIAPAETRSASPLALVSHHENLAQFYSSNDDHARVNPRGPPSSSIQ
jgi:hypothetical protein